MDEKERFPDTGEELEDGTDLEQEGQPDPPTAPEDPEPEPPTATYSYNPAKLKENGIDKMRFQLGDTLISGGAETCVLCDEEYMTLISESQSWKKAKIECLKAILAKLAYEVNYSADGLSFSLSDRYQRFADMLKAESKSAQVPTANPAALGKNRLDGGHYFYVGMLNNPAAPGSENHG